jgi:hypothetical protein
MTYYANVGSNNASAHRCAGVVAEREGRLEAARAFSQPEIGGTHGHPVSVSAGHLSAEIN